jgi:hypothetical protein
MATAGASNALRAGESNSRVEAFGRRIHLRGRNALRQFAGGLASGVGCSQPGWDCDSEPVSAHLNYRLASVREESQPFSQADSSRQKRALGMTLLAALP